MLIVIDNNILFPMLCNMSNKMKFIGLVALFALALPGCKKQELDLEKYEAVCAKVSRCDKKFQELSKVQAMQGQGGDAKAMCQKALAKWEQNKQFSALVPQVVTCLNEVTCEELSMSTCFSKATQGMQLPNLK